ncbi:MAG TPA: lysophospholipid acyltransferase family protein [Elusimicrobiota bacterium]|nr:lysophospholipid acyltransferase family protein [Elusimicrobiota bacterium]HMX95162.1 lysophospholipid acyltransferase family protein [Elusimicrobiota bacterium]HMZ26415.1 lysophospholipid acyltransferase family protein [Elusimicrobiota bacterium]HNC73979.1 lysophospholipid acyltransferase family protein [Elusimicrobiota bacterium]HNI57014.1 lysophospholipid acyltransferase family protein [Elusimicrobiota bacterium]
MDDDRRFRYRLESLGVLGLVRVLGSLPPMLGRRAGAALGRILGAVAGKRRRRAEENLRLAFPEVDDAQRAAWARDLWLQLGRAAWEFARLARLSPEAYLASVDVRGLDRVQASAAAGKGVLLFTAHIGNWEYTTPFLSLAGLRLAVIARRIKNPYVDALVTAVRARFNTRVIRHREAVRESLRWLRSGGVLGLLFDQRITEGGLSVPFFGRPARTTGLPALLALRVGCPVHPVHSYREGDRLIIECGPALDISPAPPTEENLRAVMGQMTAVVEGWIRRHPSQWLWIHNRWKP